MSKPKCKPMLSVDEKLATKQDLRELELRMTVRLGSMLAASVAILAALIAFSR